jgi:hypothetical protein
MGGSRSKSGSRCNTLTAANGDTLVLSMVGRGGSDPTHGFGTSTVVGGTGRFQGTTGSYEQAITFALLPRRRLTLTPIGSRERSPCGGKSAMVRRDVVRVVGDRLGHPRGRAIGLRLRGLLGNLTILSA